MTKIRKPLVQPSIREDRLRPSLDIRKIGVVTRDYRVKFSNGYRDFTYTWPRVLGLLDDNECDTVLFSLFSIIPRGGFNPRIVLNELKNIKYVLLEEFQDGESREAVRYVVYYRAQSDWEEYELHQVFATITGITQKEINNFVNNEMPKRILGSCCVLLCGETNGVKYSKCDKKIHDTFGLREAITPNANVILNPIHDRMTRFEMKLKRRFLSENNRWVISVWNKGKQAINGSTRDGNGPAWTIFHDGEEVQIQVVQNDFGVDVGILDISKA